MVAVALAAVMGLLSAAAPARAQSIAYADSYGWDPTDATAALQAAIDTKRDIVIVRDMGSPWIIGETIMLQSNQTLIFEPGVVVQAKRGAFQGTMDSLFFMDRKSNIHMIGYGATFEMWKQDYADPSKYTFGEWRHGIRTKDVSNVIIEGLTIRNTGGDGIYLGTTRTDNGHHNTNVTIRNVNLIDNYRQGVSVISADGLLIENTNFYNTSGTWPQAGIDFEPNDSFSVIQNVTLRNNVFHGNSGSGIMMYLARLSDPHGTAGVVENNTIIDNGSSDPTFRSGIAAHQDLPQWTFRDNLIVSNNGWGMAQLEDGANRTAVSYTAFWDNQLGATHNIAEGPGVVKDAQPVFISTDINHPYYMWLDGTSTPQALLAGSSDGRHLGGRGVLGAPTMPGTPIAGFLFDEPYTAAGDRVTDRFGSRHGVTNLPLTGTALPLVSSDDTPFSYAGNGSIRSTMNNDNRTGFVSWDSARFAQAMDGASAISFQLWVKYEEGSLRVSDHVNLLMGLAVDGGTGMLYVYLDETGSVRVGGRSTVTDEFQSADSQIGRTSVDQWNHIVGVLDFAGDAIRIAVNGRPFESFDVDFGSDVLVAGSNHSGLDLLFNRTFSNRFPGLIDELALWDFALTQEQVAWLSQNSLAEIPVPEPGTLGAILVLAGALGGRRVRMAAN